MPIRTEVGWNTIRSDVNDLKKPIIALAVIISSVIFAVCLYNQGLFLPGWITWKERTSEFEGGTLSLKNRTLTWQKDETILWQSEPGWLVSDYAVSDFDSDGREEVLFLLWRKGNYGSSHPFWEEPDTDSFFQHLYIFESDRNTLKRQWMSSALLPQFHDWSLEGTKMHVTDAYGESSVWIWQGRGVTRIE